MRHRALTYGYCEVYTIFWVPQTQHTLPAYRLALKKSPAIYYLDEVTCRLSPVVYHLSFIVKLGYTGLKLVTFLFTPE